jgi:hypothetical protein
LKKKHQVTYNNKNLKFILSFENLEFRIADAKRAQENFRKARQVHGDTRKYLKYMKDVHCNFLFCFCLLF